MVETLTGPLGTLTPGNDLDPANKLFAAVKTAIASTSAGGVRDKGGQEFNPDAYTGADDQAKVDAALAAAATAGKGDVILTREFEIDTTITPASNVRIVAKGGGGLRLADGANTHLVTLANANSAVIGLTLDGNRANNTDGAAVNIGAADCVVQGCTISGVASTLGAVRLISGGMRATVAFNAISDCAGHGIVADGNGAATLQHDPLIFGNQIDDPVGKGIYVGTGVLRARILGNRITATANTTQIAIELTGACDRGIVALNQITMLTTVASGSGMGVSIGGNDYCQVLGNNIVGTATYGIECHGDYLIVEGNVINATGGIGIAVPVSATVGPFACRIAGNTIRNAGSYGVRISGVTLTAQGTAIEGNTIIDPGNTAIHVELDTDTTINGNKIWFTTTARSGIISAGANTQINGNRITYDAGITTAAGIAISRTGGAVCQIHDNLITGNGKVLDGISGASGNTSTSIRGNTIRGTTSDIIIQNGNSATNVVEGNIMHATSGSGLTTAALVRVGRNLNESTGRWTQGLFATATWDIPSLNDGDLNSATTVTVTGATLGAEVIVTLNQNLAGVRIWGSVTSTNTVTLYASNETGGIVDVASGTVWVQVINR